MADLVVFYSLSGKSRQIATEIARVLGADLAPIIEMRPRPWPGSTLRSLLDSLLRRMPAIRPTGVDVPRYARVILAAPVWAGRIAGPARTWLAGEGKGAKGLGLAVQFGGWRAEGAVAEVTALAGHTPAVLLMTSENDFVRGTAIPAARAFAAGLKPAAVPARSS
jgi:hypothetical protein